MIDGILRSKLIPVKPGGKELGPSKLAPKFSGNHRFQPRFHPFSVVLQGERRLVWRDPALVVQSVNLEMRRMRFHELWKKYLVVLDAKKKGLFLREFKNYTVKLQALGSLFWFWFTWCLEIFGQQKSPQFNHVDIGSLTSQDEVSGLVDLVQCSLHALQPPGSGGCHVAELR